MATHQAPPSLGFSRQEHWSGLPFPSPVQESEKWKWSHSVMSDISLPHRPQPTRLLHPWDFPGKSTGVGRHCHCLGICIFAIHLLVENRPKRNDSLAWSCDGGKSSGKEPGCPNDFNWPQWESVLCSWWWVVGNAQNQKEKGSLKTGPCEKSSGLGKQIPGFYFSL